MASIWGSANLSRLYPLRMLQKRAIESVFGYDKMTSSENFFKETGIMKLEDVIHQAQATICHAITQGYRTCNTTFNKNLDVHHHNTRHRKDIRRTSSNSTKNGLNSIYNSIATSYNNLP